MKIRNPIIPGFYPDPSICRVGHEFYLVTSSFEYFPGVPIFHSTDLINWRQIGHCLITESQLQLPNARISGGIYAPTLRYHDGVFYMVTTNTTQGGNFFVTATDPAGPWSEPKWVDHPGIDPDMFWDDDGTCYFTSCGSLQSTIDPATGARLTDVRELWSGTGGQYPEAPHLYKINAHYYLLLAEGGTEYGHMVTIARSGSPEGPWDPCPHNPILTHRSIASPIQATGHADLVDDQGGNWWMVFLGIRPIDHHPAHHLGRETFLAPVRWTDDGWPVVGNDGTVAMEMEVDAGPPAGEAVEFAGHDDFDEDTLAMHWNFRGNPVPDAWSLTDRPGSLVLSCVPQALGDLCGQAWVGRRQQHFSMRVSTGLLFEPRSENEEAGICVFQNVNHHYEVAVTLRGGEKRAVVRRRIGSLISEVASVPVPDGRVDLVIEGDAREYRLGLMADDAKPHFHATGEARYLSSEVGGRFTGVYVGMYATGNGMTTENSASFDFFRYEVL